MSRVYNFSAGPAVLPEQVLQEAAAEMMNLARLGNKYLAESEPWKVVKTDAVRTEAIMYTALQIAASLTTMCEPFVPFAAGKLAGWKKQFSAARILSVPAFADGANGGRNVHTWCAGNSQSAGKLYGADVWI